MKLMRVGSVGAERPAVLTDADETLDLSGVTADLGAGILAPAGIARIRRAAESGALPRIQAAGARTGAPVARPGKVVCIGLNCRDHLRKPARLSPSGLSCS